LLQIVLYCREVIAKRDRGRQLKSVQIKELIYEAKNWVDTPEKEEVRYGR
jgi:hypothetical protein